MKSDATLPIGSQKPNAAVFVWDRKSGNLASKTVKDALASTWVVKPEDFKDIAQVAVHVEHSGKPVAAATVDLDDGRRKSTQLLAPSSNGTVTFFGIKPGSLKITVRYKVAGKEGKPVTQLMDAALGRTDPIPSVTISLADAADTVGAVAPAAGQPASGGATDGAAAGKTGDEKAPKKESGGLASFFGSLVIYIIVLGAAVTGVYYAVMYMKNNPDSVGSKLEQLGVQIPKSPSPGTENHPR